MDSLWFLLPVLALTFAIVAAIRRKRMRRKLIEGLARCLVGRCEHEGLELVSLSQDYLVNIFTSLGGQSLTITRNGGNWDITITIDLRFMSTPLYELKLNAACGERMSFPCGHESHVAIRNWIKRIAVQPVL